ncbi:hypothetical protein RMB03_07720 [Acinetobacter sp. V91_7]|uniref:hypothetical protein n=1 Tax=unclassified Acinetobacter TaxID=196816 RepID=UPI00287E4D0D|nr:MULTISPECIES: hypothetical protein [unclassified Acinetobacter]MDS7933093.1 hypothetical protein [Acinetobacter sp. V91_4B]MDS7962844.1 hypothetical protein [Acinetobacter sp. V91_7]MDS8026167.1 hypothetical protein [Acinetobacter sp. V91_13]
MNYWKFLVAVLATVLSATFFSLLDTIIFRSVNFIAPEKIALLVTEATAITLTILGYKTLFKEQLKKVCRENFLYYRLNFNIFFIKI